MKWEQPDPALLHNGSDDGDELGSLLGNGDGASVGFRVGDGAPADTGRRMPLSERRSEMITKKAKRCLERRIRHADDGTALDVPPSPLRR